MQLFETISPEPVTDQHRAFEASRPGRLGEILRFDGVDGRDVYNPSVPFKLDGMTVMAGRVESRDGHGSVTMFFTPSKDGVWRPIAGAPTLELEDPFVTFAGEQLILGGVRVEWEDTPPGAPPVAHWCTDFYRGRSLDGLRRFATGPDQMKDIRLLQLRDSRVAIFTRPQGAVMEPLGCIAKIGFTLADSLDDVTPEAIKNAPLLYDHFLPDEWGGCNQLFELADRACFPDGPAKEPRLRDVTFTAGIVRNDDGTADLYTGLSDCQVGRLRIEDPLSEYERLGVDQE